MPYPNEHAARINDPDKYVKFARENDKFGNGIDVIWGVLPDGKTEVQAIRFDKGKFTVKEAKKWLKDHDYKYIEFEPASEEKGMKPLEYEYRAVMADAKIEGRTIRGYAAVFDSPSVYMGFREFVRKGAFSKTIKESDIRALWNHEDGKVLGRVSAGTLRLEEDDKGLKVEIDLPESTLGNDALESIKRGDVSQMSFRFQCIKDDWRVDESDGITCRDLIEVRLMEVSPVTFPAYPETSISARSIANAANKVSGNADESLFRALMALNTGNIDEEQRAKISAFAVELQNKTKAADKPLENNRHLKEKMKMRLDLETM